MKKFLPLLAAVLLMLSACTPESATPTPTASPPAPTPSPSSPPMMADIVEISVVTSYGGDDGNRQNYEKAIAAYEAASGNIVRDASGISSEAWKSQIMAGFEAGTEPDVLFYFTGVDSNQLIQSGRVVSVEEIRALYPDYASNMKDDVMAKSPLDGQLYAVPVNGYWEGLYVNKQVLADCGLAIPGADMTWEEFLATCQTIADKGYVPIAASLMEVPHYWFEFCVFNHSSAENHALLPASSGDAIGQSWVSGLNDIKELYERGFFPENTLQMTSAETDALMINNQAAFMIEGSWKLGWMAENAADINNFTVTYVPGQGRRQSTDIIGGLSMGYFITRQAWENPDKQAVCVEFVQAMTTDEVVTTFGATAVTALKKGITPPEEASSLVKDALTMTKNVTSVTGATADNLSQAARSDLFLHIVDIVTGAMTAEDAVDQCLAAK